MNTSSPKNWKKLERALKLHIAYVECHQRNRTELRWNHRWALFIIGVVQIQCVRQSDHEVELYTSSIGRCIRADETDSNEHAFVECS